MTTLSGGYFIICKTTQTALLFSVFDTKHMQYDIILPVMLAMLVSYVK
jgi:hypothetical protein